MHWWPEDNRRYGQDSESVNLIGSCQRVNNDGGIIHVESICEAVNTEDELIRRSSNVMTSLRNTLAIFSSLEAEALHMGSGRENITSFSAKNAKKPAKSDQFRRVKRDLLKIRWAVTRISMSTLIKQKSFGLDMSRIIYYVGVPLLVPTVYNSRFFSCIAFLLYILIDASPIADDKILWYMVCHFSYAIFAYSNTNVTHNRGCFFRQCTLQYTRQRNRFCPNHWWKHFWVYCFQLNQVRTAAMLLHIACGWLSTVRELTINVRFDRYAVFSDGCWVFLYPHNAE